MTKPQHKHMPYLDGWRGLAVSLLLVGHFFPVRGINLGALGVNFFFVLSGLLMARLLFINEVPIPTFYRRRIARIFPLAYFFLAAVTCWRLISAEPVNWSELMATATFLNNYLRPGTPVMPFGHFWSLCVEEHGYVVLALIAWGARAGYFNAHRAIGLALLCFAAFGAFYSLGYAGPDLYHERWLRSEVSAFGIFVSAFILLCLRGGTSKVNLIVIATLVAAGLALHWWRVSPFWRTFAGVTALAAAVNLLEHAPGWAQTVLSFMPLRRLGVWSFSIYVWQQPFYVAVEAQQLSAAAGFALALSAGVISFYLIEQPVRIWLNQRWNSHAVRAKDELRQGLMPLAQEQPVAPTKRF
jgi:peptidoglycan/LPS O-acetylase OafA/YrhL